VFGTLFFLYNYITYTSNERYDQDNVVVCDIWNPDSVPDIVDPFTGAHFRKERDVGNTIY
jgi:hypothetical protein